MSRITLAEAVRDPSVPRKKGPGGEWLYPWPEFNVWWHKTAADRAVLKAAKLAARANGAGEASPLDLLRIRKLEAEIAEAELGFARRRGDLMTVDEHLALVRAVVERVRSGLLALPGRVAPTVLGCKTIAEAQGKLVRAVDDILQGMAARE